MVKKRIIDTINENRLIEKGEHIVVGLSGGPDSVCLFYVLHQLAEEMNISLYPVHINHKFRPGAAESDQKYCEDLCRKLGYECRSFVFDCSEIARQKKITGEEAGRLVRYQSFAQAAEEIHEKGVPKDKIKIAVAQNADDQAETVLFRIVRGAGIDGISGISYSRFDENGYEIIRPLLDVYKKQVLEFCEENRLNPCIDATNLEEIYTRNKLRLDLIPHIEEKFNPAFKDALIRMADSARTDKEYIYSQALAAYEKACIKRCDSYITLDGDLLKQMHKAVRVRIFSTGLSALGLSQDVAYVHYEGIDAVLMNDKPSARIDLPEGYYATKVYENLRLAKAAADYASPQGSRDEGTAYRRDFCIRVEPYNGEIKSDCPGNRFAAFDYEQMTAELGADFEKKLVLDTRNPGDRLYISDTGSKKIQDYFVDAKIPKDDRDKIVMLKYQSQVLWIMLPDGKVRYTGKYKVTNTTNRIIYIEL